MITGPDIAGNLASGIELTNDPHVLCGILKQYFRELPEPVIPSQSRQRFVAASSKCSAAGVVLPFVLDRRGQTNRNRAR